MEYSTKHVKQKTVNAWKLWQNTNSLFHKEGQNGNNIFDNTVLELMNICLCVLMVM
jgi:hypothetical protein